MPKTKVTERDTKAAILAAYEELNAEIKQLQSENRRVRVAPPTPSPDAPNSPAGEGIDSLFQDLDRLRTRFGGTAGSLQAKLTAEAEQLGALREQVESQIS